MTDAEIFSLIILVFYIADGLRALRPGAVLFRERRPGCFEPDRPEQRAATGREPGTLALLPFFPHRLAIPAEPLCLHFSLEAVRCPGVERLPPSVNPLLPHWELAWEQVRAVRRDGSHLEVAPKPPVRQLTRTLAEWISTEVRQLWQSGPGERAKHLAGLETHVYDGEGFRTELAQVRQTLRLQQWAGSGLALLWFAVVPLVGRLELRVPLAAILTVHGLLTLTLIALFVRNSRRLQPYRTAWQRLGGALQLMVSPADAMRSAQALGYEALSTRHPLCVAATVLEKEAFGEFARRTWRGLTSPLQGQGTLEELLRLRQHLEPLVVARGLDPDTFQKPPPPQDSSCTSYCPRCELQFTQRGGHCSSCRETLLEPLEQSLQA